jgi:hypothetical protein
MVSTEYVKKLIINCLLYSLVVALIDLVAVLLLSPDFGQVIYKLTLLLLIEGGLALVVGGAIATYSPVLSKVSEVLFRTKPWSSQGRKEAEKQGEPWIVSGFILVVVGLLISAL